MACLSCGIYFNNIQLNLETEALRGLGFVITVGPLNLKRVMLQSFARSRKSPKLQGLDVDGVLIVVTQRRTKPRSICAPDYMLGIYDVLRRRRRKKFSFFGKP